MGARGERSLPVIAPTRRPAATDTEIGMPWAAVLGPKERGPVSLPEAVLPEADGSVG